MQVQHRRTNVRLGPIEIFKHEKDLKRLDHKEGEDGRVSTFFTPAFGAQPMRHICA